MKKILLNPVKTGLLLASFILVCGIANGTTYTAVASGNWSSTTTWGGTAPPFMLTSADQVMVGVGINVTMDQNVTLNNALAGISVTGTLSSAANIILTVTSGTLSGTGNISAAEVILNSAGGLTFSGVITADTLMNSILALSSAAQIMVNNELMLSGIVTLTTGGMLKVGANSEITMSGGGLTLSGGTIDLSAAYNVNYITTSATAGLELSGSGLRNVTVNVGSGNAVKLSADLILDTLNLMSGILTLNGNNLSINGNLTAGGTGVILSTAASNINVSASTSFTGSLMLSASGDTVNNLAVNIAAGGSLTLGSDIVINGTLNFMNGFVDIGNYNLNIGVSGSVSGEGTNAYVITNGTGNLNMYATVSNTTTFAVGTSTNYFPAAITLNTGSATGTIGVNVSAGVYSAGTSGVMISATQPMVNATWLFQNNIGSGINANMMLSWEASAEVNGFVHTGDYISHYESFWDDINDSMTATLSGSLYSVTRANITSMSPFAVFDQQTVPTGINEVVNATSDLVIYPNPASQNLYVNNPYGGTTVVYIEIYNTLGQEVTRLQSNDPTIHIPVSGLPSGDYLIKFYNDRMSAVKKFVKL